LLDDRRARRETHLACDARDALDVAVVELREERQGSHDVGIDARRAEPALLDACVALVSDHGCGCRRARVDRGALEVIDDGVDVLAAAGVVENAKAHRETSAQPCRRDEADRATRQRPYEVGVGALGLVLAAVGTPAEAHDPERGGTH